MSAQAPGRQEKVEEARWLEQHGLSRHQIAEFLGVGIGTIYRWLSPEIAERQREQSRRYKKKLTGICIDCGATTPYGGKKTPGRCTDCNRVWQQQNKHWTRENVIDAIQRFAAENGRPPISTEWIKVNHEKDYPPRSAVYQAGQRGNKPFKSWADAIEAAGFPRPKVGHKVLEWEPRVGPIQRDILALFEKRERLIVPAVVTLLPQYNEQAIRNTLSHMYKRGKLTRPHRGVYALNKPEDQSG